MVYWSQYFHSHCVTNVGLLPRLHTPRLRASAVPRERQGDCLSHYCLSFSGKPSLIATLSEKVPLLRNLCDRLPCLLDSQSLKEGLGLISVSCGPAQRRSMEDVGLLTASAYHSAFQTVVYPHTPESLSKRRLSQSRSGGGA